MPINREFVLGAGLRRVRAIFEKRHGRRAIACRSLLEALGQLCCDRRKHVDGWVSDADIREASDCDRKTLRVRKKLLIDAGLLSPALGGGYRIAFFRQNNRFTPFQTAPEYRVRQEGAPAIRAAQWEANRRAAIDLPHGANQAVKAYRGATHRHLTVHMNLANEYERRFLLACKHVFGYPKHAVIKALKAEMPLDGPDAESWREELQRYAAKAHEDS